MPDPEAAAPATPTDRLRAALLRPSRRQLVAAVLLALLGFGAVTQVRLTGVDDDYTGLREQELIDLLDGLAGTRQRTEAEIDRLEEVASGLRDDSTKRQTAIDQADDEVDSLNILAGLVPVTGPGLRVRITEDDGRMRLASLLDTIQELRTVGAEAIAVNGTARVVAQTSFAETNGGFEIDGERVEGPYVIEAIGEPSVLAGAITFSLGPRKQLEDDGATVEVEERRTIDIEAVVQRDQPSYAVPDQGQ
ncbi:DUF881 domain-containing protein [Nocardioides carbamazepini]|jgi:uncharacterized protein YlxW (UPF0749 family)|uniref:DUF881 domain-containing protein n=1 Tax=Nocardioides carbamazepini TaxID=2854259 RepID=UPI002149A825|nr:DUF881 domain-containing protein [Nocardioides carbamazepini]MCR1780963.1 DUF881 domain-containing protein [Nocardioides carbamazepini]